ncbi:major facilitator superfamily-domain-containing protein [Apiospora aurea]|uniref:Major facilitator superfamily-domain-containing protein n=1 Tax=Apiospora aurea TaxID=335848 RepID=A0ABR1QKM2_9PEZI
MTETATVTAAGDMIELLPITNNVVSHVPHPPHIGNDSEAAAVAGCEPDPNARPAAFRSLVHDILFVLTATMSIAMKSFLQGSILIVSPDIKTDLDMATSQLTWVVAASSLTSGSFLLFFGKVANLFGRRSILLTSLFLFALHALATGFARNAVALIVLNAAMGLTSAIYERPSRRKNYAFACFSSGNHLEFAVSAVFSGVATQVAGWSALVWLLAVMYAAVAIIACFTVPADYTEELPLNRESLKQFDFGRVLLAICGMVLLTAGISVGPDSPQCWRTSYIIAFLVLGPVLLLAFVWWETRFPYPLMPMGVWRDKEFRLLLTILLLGFLSFPVLLFFFSALYLQEIFGYSALMTASILPGRLLHKVSNKLLMGTGAAGFTISFLVVAVQWSGASYWAFTFNSVFQTTIKLATVLGLGICATLFASEAEQPAGSGYYAGDPFEPYAALFWFAAAVSFISLLIVPLLHIKTQGHMKKA